MISGNLDKQFQTHLINTRKLLSSYKKHKKREDLHHLRVEIKKIRALVSFVNEVHHQSYTVNKLKPLFKEAGQIREADVYLQRLKHIPKNSPIIKQINQKKRSDQTKFNKNISAYIKTIREYERGFKGKINLADTKLVKKYFKHGIRRANKRSSERKPKALHEFRKDLKILLYNYKAIPKSYSRSIELDLKKIDGIQEKLGSWHDTNSFMNFLTSLPNTHLIISEIKRLLKAEKKEFKTCLKLRL